MALGAFGIMTALSYLGYEAEIINDFRGFAVKNRWVALLMTFIMFSLAGIPPFCRILCQIFCTRCTPGQSGFKCLASGVCGFNDCY